MKKLNEFKAEFPSMSANESFARSCVTCFAAQLDPTLTELNDIKTAVSEAVTNCIVHAYPGCIGRVVIKCRILNGDVFELSVKDNGVGIEDIALARTPLYTGGNPEERAGMGFSIMESFTDEMRVRSRPGRGTVVVLRKRIGGGSGK